MTTNHKEGKNIEMVLCFYISLEMLEYQYKLAVLCIQNNHQKNYTVIYTKHCSRITGNIKKDQVTHRKAGKEKQQMKCINRKQIIKQHI